MATTQLAVREESRPLWLTMNQPGVMKKFEIACGKQAGSVMINIINAANTNPQIWDCEPNTVISAALNAASLNLSIAPGLGQACILPFKKSWKDGNEWRSESRAQLVVMLRGVKQMAMRTNKYRVLNAFKVYQGQTWVEDQRTGVGYPDGPIADKSKVIGYGAYLKLFNGYEASVYKTTEEVLAHGKKYSPTFDKKNGRFQDKSRWVTDFDEQALKTVMKDLIMNHGEISETDRAVLEQVESDKEGGPVWPDDPDDSETFEGETSSALEAKSEPEIMKSLGYEEDYPALPADWEAAKEAKQAEKKPEPAKSARPYAPDMFLEKFEVAVEVITKNNHLDQIGEREQRIIASAIDGIFSGERIMRHEVCKWLTGHASTKEMSKAQLKALMHIMNINDFNQAPSMESIAEIRQAHAEALRANGQQELLPE